MPSEPITPLTEDQLAFLTEQTTRAAHRAVQRYIKGALIGFAILAGGTGYALSTKADTNRLETASYSFCDRLNRERAKTNLSDSVSFNILSLSSRRELALAKEDPSTRSIHAKSSRALAKEARRLGVTPLTNCTDAVGNPANYINPQVGPIGKPLTGEVPAEVRAILTESQKYLKTRTTQRG